MIPDKVIVEASPLGVHQEGVFGLGQGSGLAHQGGYRSADGEVDPFDESGLDEVGEANGFEFVGQGFALFPEHAGDGVGQLAAAFAFDQLAIQQVFIDLPVIGWSSAVKRIITA
jgi:hypothetical protein